MGRKQIAYYANPKARGSILGLFIHLNIMYLLVAPMLAAACSLTRSLLATNVYNLTFLYHICIGKINELVLFCLDRLRIFMVQ